MSSSRLFIKAQPKEKNALKKGLINAILYGPKVKNIAFALKEKEFMNIFKKAGETQVIEIQFDNDKTQEVLIHDFQVHPINGNIIHVDFFAFEKGKEIKVKVPLEFIGVAPAVKELGGVFIVNARDIEVKCQAGKIPKKLVVEISNLKKIHDEIVINDIKFPKGVAPVQPLQTVIASVVAPRQEEVEIKPEAAITTEATDSAQASTVATPGQFQSQAQSGQTSTSQPTTKK